MEEILDSGKQRSYAVADPEAWTAEVEKSQSPAQAAAAAALTDEEVNRMVHKAR